MMSDFSGDVFGLSMNVWIIIFAAIVTYFTRIIGHVVLSRFDVIHPRVEAGLNAVPAAVVTAIVVPAVLTGGWAEVITIIIAIIASLKLSMMQVFFIGWVFIVGLRAIGL